MISAGSAALLFSAGVLAGVVGTAGGITSLVSYPALLAVGVPALPANVANLVAAGSLVLLAQPWLTARTQRRHRGSVRPPTLVGVGVLSVYSGYFGAGAGVLLLALLLVLVDDRMPQANAGKNMLLGACGVASAAVFIVMGPVEWGVVAPLAAGLFIGSLWGPLVVRRLPASAVRWAVAVLGLGLAVRLWLHPI